MPRSTDDYPKTIVSPHHPLDFVEPVRPELDVPLVAMSGAGVIV
jgi:hypothetical protein